MNLRLCGPSRVNTWLVTHETSSALRPRLRSLGHDRNGTGLRICNSANQIEPTICRREMHVVPICEHNCQLGSDQVCWLLLRSCVWLGRISNLRRVSPSYSPRIPGSHLQYFLNLSFSGKTMDHRSDLEPKTFSKPRGQACV